MPTIKYLISPTLLRSLITIAALFAGIVGLTSCHSKETDQAAAKADDTNFVTSSSTNEPAASATTPTATSAPTATPPTSTANGGELQALRDAYHLDTQGKFDDALVKVNSVVQMDPKNVTAYVLRGDIYSRKKQFDLSQKDYETVLQLAPGNSTASFNISELKFMQKYYDDARPGFLALENDPDLGDLATYKVFLCDLFGGRTDAAQKEFDAFNVVGGNASFYFANIAWSLYHKNVDDARSWLASAQRIYPPQKFGLYATSLHDLGYLPLPTPPAN